MLRPQTRSTRSTSRLPTRPKWTNGERRLAVRRSLGRTGGTERADRFRRNKTYAYFLSVLLPRLADLFPMSAAQKAAFGPSAYLVAGDAEREGYEMERQEAEVWGLAAA